MAARARGTKRKTEHLFRSGGTHFFPCALPLRGDIIWWSESSLGARRTHRLAVANISANGATKWRCFGDASSCSARSCDFRQWHLSWHCSVCFRRCNDRGSEQCAPCRTRLRYWHIMKLFRLGCHVTRAEIRSEKCLKLKQTLYHRALRIYTYIKRTDHRIL